MANGFGEVKGAVFDEFIEGAGLIDDADVTWRSVRFAKWDYNGKISSPVLAMKIEMVDNEGKVHEQYGSAGDLKYFQPSPDGKKAVPQTPAVQKLNVNTNAIMTLVSLINADSRGELATKVRSTDDISVLDGVKVHIKREKQPERPGIVSPEMQAAGTTGRRAAEYIKVTQILAYPWESAPAQQTQASGAAAPAAQSSPVEDIAVGVLCGVLANNGNKLKIGAIAGKLFSDDGFKANEAATRNQILGMITKPEFLGAAGRPWQYNQQAGEVSLG